MALVDRGICYTVDGMSPELVRDDLRTIREELHCTAVTLIGAETSALLEAANVAAGLELHVYIRPQLPSARARQLVVHLQDVASAAERVRQQHPGGVTLVLGTELSLTSRAAIPLGSEFLRLLVILRLGRLLKRHITRRVNALLAELIRTARVEFDGPITYAAAYWEEIDWSGMDVVGVNLYRMGDDRRAYQQHLRSLVHDAGKPVVITEFGCGAHTGADRRGPGSFLIVNWFRDPPRVRPGHVRDESVQAAYLSELIDLYAGAGAHGCFVFTFAMPDFPYDPDPQSDLDMAGFAVVRASCEPGERWTRKKAFSAVADRYASLAG
ncbi:glycoside hydrolase family 113 [Myceligenerans xiligouense]|uniref:Abortive infection protein n=1 Tax=Myceligenerans xiligouense TaxID=253184 RepID=A0A3N4YT33_9MICO|nr:hypothetical protein [Myceligenerans xiligouense]RPF22534.1 hypothetical protein EDD34_3199 [Myceligenerans xiligouense]